MTLSIGKPAIGKPAIGNPADLPGRNRNAALTEINSRRKRAAQQCYLDRYFRRGHIDARRYAAGRRLYEDWYRSGSQPYLVAAYDGQAPQKVRSSGGGPTDYQAVLRLRVNEALRQVGSGLSPILVHVCLLDQAAKDWAAARGEGTASGITVLRLALEVLADHYRIAADLQLAEADAR